MKIFSSILCGTIIMLTFLFLPASAAAQYGVGDAVGDAFTGSEPLTEDELNAMLRQPQLRIKLPGLEKFTKPDVQSLTTEDDEGNRYVSIPYAGEYIAAVYRFAIAAVGIISVLMIIAAGLQWMTSAGNSDRVSKAKSRIEHSLIGVLLAVGSYLFLFTINPNLVEFKNLKVFSVARKEFPDNPEYDELGIDPGLIGVAAKMSYNLPEGKIPCDNPTIYGLVKIPKMPGVKYIGRKGNDYLLPEVIEPLKKAGEIAASQNLMIGISTGCRPLSVQNELANKNPAGVKLGTTARAGKSPHGFGYALDIHLLDKNGKSLTCPNKEKCIVGQASNGGQCEKAQKYPEILNALKKQSEIMLAAGWVRLTTESWHYEYGTAGKFCRGQCLGLASLCNGTAPDDCKPNVNGCKN